MHEFKLAGYSLREAKNLGVTLSEDGPLDSKAVKRIEKLNNVLRVFRGLGVFTHGVQPANSIRLYKPLGRSRWEYGMHLTRRTRRRSQEDARYVLRTNLGKAAKGESLRAEHCPASHDLSTKTNGYFPLLGS